MTYKVLVTCKQMQESLEELLAENPMPDFSFTTPELTKQGFTSSEMAELMEGHDAAIVGDDVVDAPVLSVPGLKFVCKWGAGVDGIDFEAANEFRVRVANTPGVFGDDVADLALGYLIVLSREILTIDARVREGQWPRVMGRSIRGLRVGVYGLGDIGLKLAARLHFLGASTVGYDIEPAKRAKAKEMIDINIADDLEGLTNGVNALCICVPLTESTAGSVNSESLKNLETGSYLVNVSRGKIVDETDLVEAIELGVLKGVALDVFEDEPLPEDSDLRGLKNVVLGSHNASNADLSVKTASSSALSLIAFALKNPN